MGELGVYMQECMEFPVIGIHEGHSACANQHDSGWREAQDREIDRCSCPMQSCEQTVVILFTSCQDLATHLSELSLFIGTWVSF